MFAVLSKHNMVLHGCSFHAR